jgi:hypothetical protein
MNHRENKNQLNWVMLPEKVLDTGKYKKINKGQKLQNKARQSYVF